MKKEIFKDKLIIGFVADPAFYDKKDIEQISTDIPQLTTVVNARHRASFINDPYIAIEIGQYVLEALVSGLIAEAGISITKAAWKQVKSQFIKVATEPKHDGVPIVGLTVYMDKPDGSKIDAKFTVQSNDPSVLKKFLDKTPSVAKEIGDLVKRSDIDIRNLFGTFDPLEQFEIKAQDRNDIYKYVKKEKSFIKDKSSK